MQIGDERVYVIDRHDVHLDRQKKAKAPGWI